MERRALLAIALSILVLVIWQGIFAPAPPPEPEPASPGAPGVGEPRPVAPAAPAGLGATPRAGPAAGTAIVAEVIGPRYRAGFGAGGGVARWALNYRGDKPLAVEAPVTPLAVAVYRAGQPPEILTLRPERARLVLSDARPVGTLRFRGETGDGLVVTKALEFRADSYQVGVTVRLERDGSGAEPVTVALYWTSPIAIPGATPEGAWVTTGEGPEQRQMLGRILVAADGEPAVAEAPAAGDLKELKATGGRAELKSPEPPVEALGPGPRWVALENDYFLAALLPPAEAQVLRGREADLTQVGVLFRDVRATAGAPWRGEVTAYVGPKEWDRLTAVGAGLEAAQARNYGRFLWTLPMQWFCVPLLWLMNIFATYVPGQNYGVAIVLLTILVKIVFYPLSQKSMTSMKKMQALQPQLNALRARHKANPQLFQREQMDLFRKHKVNPMGGCLPMVVQIPIFYALYLTLQYSVELQGAPFVLWITDLSKKDPYYVLPILMGASMFLQQLMTPTVGDPRQARIMLVLPVVFTFMFLEFPTGLVLYWLVNNLLSIGQQHLIDRAARRAAPLAPVENAEPKKPKKAEKARR